LYDPGDGNCYLMVFGTETARNGTGTKLFSFLLHLDMNLQWRNVTSEIWPRTCCVYDLIALPGCGSMYNSFFLCNGSQSRVAVYRTPFSLILSWHFLWCVYPCITCCLSIFLYMDRVGLYDLLIRISDVVTRHKSCWWAN
jgi:hypothetical protein